MYPNNKHANPLQIGEAYQRKVAEAIKAQYNYQIHYYTDNHDQYNIGESSEGFEIKYDSWIGRSGRLSIEIGEKTKIILPVFSASGIFRKDNTIWYCQGDDREFPGPHHSGHSGDSQREARNRRLSVDPFL